MANLVFKICICPARCFWTHWISDKTARLFTAGTIGPSYDCCEVLSSKINGTDVRHILISEWIRFFQCQAEQESSAILIDGKVSMREHHGLNATQKGDNQE